MNIAKIVTVKVHVMTGIAAKKTTPDEHACGI